MLRKQCKFQCFMHILLVLFWWVLFFNKIKYKEHQLIWALFTSKLHTLCRFCDLYFFQTGMRSKKCIILTRVHKACIYSKQKTTTLWCKKCTLPAYTQKNKDIKNLTLYVGLTGIGEFFLVEYRQVWWLFTIKTFDFFEYMQVWGTWGDSMPVSPT